MLNRHLPHQPLRPPPDRQLTVADLLAIALIVFVLSGGITYMLPGAAYEKNPPPPPAAPRQPGENLVRLANGCTVALPHGKRRCVMGTIRGGVVHMEGY